MTFVLLYVTIDLFRTPEEHGRPSDWKPYGDGGSYREEIFGIEDHPWKYEALDADQNLVAAGTCVESAFERVLAFHQNDTGAIDLRITDRKTGKREMWP